VGPHWKQLGLDIWNSLWDSPIGKDVGSVHLRSKGRLEALIWEFKPHLRFSLEVAIGELLDGDYWGPDGVRKGGAAVMDLLEAGREGTKDNPVEVGVYFKDIDPSTPLLPPQLGRALMLLHNVVAGPYDLVKHHPLILGVTGNRMSACAMWQTSWRCFCASYIASIRSSQRFCPPPPPPLSSQPKC
jgi:hypothetical protein